MSEWISVKDRLPEPHTKVLLAHTRTEMIEAGYYMPECSCETKWHGIGSVPTHWMPLPDPPESA